MRSYDSRSYIRSYYDAYGRVIKETKPGPQNSTQTYRVSYNGFTTITTDAKNIRKYVQKDVNGKLIKVIDAYGTSVASQITYAYDASENLISTRDSKGHIIRMTYDAFGNKIGMNDPDLGQWSYQYNALGQLISQRDANGAITTIRYDKLGRMYQKFVLKGGWKNYNYYYNVYHGAGASKGSRGKLYYAYASSKMDGKDWHGERKYSYYDSFGRVTKVVNRIYNKGEYTVSTSYDRYSRPLIITYPSGYKITNHYRDGMLDYIKGSDGKIHYRVDALTALGQVKKAIYGNGVVTNKYYDDAGYMSSIVSGVGYASGTVQRINYTYDALGNVISRHDYSIQGKYINESFRYDAMNRLTRFDVSTDVKVGAFLKSKVYKYDQLGNMTYQTGVGTYRYSSIRPHAVVSTSGNREIYKYDNNGNMTYNRGRNIVYNPINKATYLTNKKGQQVSFYYGVGGKRYMKTNGEYATYYVGKLYEEKVGNGYSIEKNYIYAGGTLVGSHETTFNLYDGSETQSTRYFHTDNLGSVTAITNSKGNVIERRSYEPFGKIRAMNYGTNNNTIANMTNWTNRAFTGHEQISELDGLVHMNARLYDNQIGRFLSADTIIQAPNDSQSYNRYSYVRNNPLMYTDPSGHSWLSKVWKKVKKYARTIAAIAVAAVLTIATGGAFIAAYGAFWGAVATGALAGFASGAIMTGTLKGALRGAVFGAISAGVAFGVAEAAGTLFNVGSDVAHSASLLKGGMTKLAVVKSMMHGLTRGLIAQAQGGTFKSGFVSGFTSSAFSVGNRGYGGFTGRTAIMAVVGGTASKLGGGKFSNGAVSGAFVHMFNADALITLKKFAESLSSDKSNIVISSGAQKGLKSTNIDPKGANIFGDMIGTGITGAAGGFVSMGPAGAVIGGVFGVATGFLYGVFYEYSGYNAAQEGVMDTVINHDYTDTFEDVMRNTTRY